MHCKQRKANTLIDLTLGQKDKELKGLFGSKFDRPITFEDSFMGDRI